MGEARRSPIIVAHRGLHRNFPENSVQGMLAALRAGFEWVECDVWATADDIPVVLHDETLERTTTGAGTIWQTIWSEVRAFHLRMADGTPVSRSAIPTLSDFQTCGDIDWMAEGLEPPSLLVEVKPCDARRLVNEIAHHAFCRMLQSFDDRNLVHSLVANPNLPVALLVEDRESLERGVAAGWDRIHLCHDLLDRSTAERLRAAAIHIGTWTVNSQDDVLRVVELGAEMVITDEPELVRDLLDREFGPM